MSTLNNAIIGDLDFDRLLKAEMQALQAQQAYYQGTTTVAPQTTQQPEERNFEFCPKDEMVDWGKFCMWLRGFLAGIEGKPLTPEDIAKIMEKLAYVDPDRAPSFQPDKFPIPPVIKPGRFIPFTPRTNPTWVYNDSNTTKWHNAINGISTLNPQLLANANTLDRSDIAASKLSADSKSATV